MTHCSAGKYLYHCRRVLSWSGIPDIQWYEMIHRTLCFSVEHFQNHHIVFTSCFLSASQCHYCYSIITPCHSPCSTKNEIKPSSLLPLIQCPVLKFMYSLEILSILDLDHHMYSDWPVAMPVLIQQGSMYCVLWCIKLFVLCSIVVLLLVDTCQKSSVPFSHQ